MRLHGLEHVLARIGMLHSGQLIAAEREAMRTGLEQIREDAQGFCPKDTGALAASIGIRMTEAEDVLLGEVFAAAPYAAPVEMGTADRAAQPFLYPAFSGGKADVTQRIAGALVRHAMDGGEAE